MSEFTSKRIAAHRANIGRYGRLLRTQLEPHERRYVLRRLAEEESALERLGVEPTSTISLRKQGGRTASMKTLGVTAMSRIHHHFRSKEYSSDLEEFLHPASAFDHPMDVVRDPDLTTYEKRAILSSWASDACAVESAPSLRRASSGITVTFDDIIDALRSLDSHSAQHSNQSGPSRSVHRRNRPSGEGRGGIGLQ